MQLNNVRYFLAVCEERSFTRAARRCGVSQASLSNSIMRLEAQLGGPLFLRAAPPKYETLPTALALAIKSDLEQALASVERVEQIAAASLAFLFVEQTDDAQTLEIPPPLLARADEVIE
jgi:DNA-binding transcriptional LysR family regulator